MGRKGLHDVGTGRPLLACAFDARDREHRCHTFYKREKAGKVAISANPLNKLASCMIVRLL